MRWLNRHPDSVRTPSGMEWVIWKKLPGFLVVGVALPLLLLAYDHWWVGTPANGATDPDVLRQEFVALGVILVYWTLLLTVAIGCVVVMLMKGPHYTADAYPVPHKDKPGK